MARLDSLRCRGEIRSVLIRPGCRFIRLFAVMVVPALSAVSYGGADSADGPEEEPAVEVAKPDKRVATTDAPTASTPDDASTERPVVKWRRHQVASCRSPPFYRRSILLPAGPSRATYICDDGSGTFAILEESGDGGQGEVTSGTGAYVGMIGTCQVAITDNEERTEVLGTCEFDMGLAE